MAFHVLQNKGISSFSLETVRLNPTEAELQFKIEIPGTISQPEFRGRLMGPQCPYATTVEIAYPLRPLPGKEKRSANALGGRVVIPEPSLWDPISPFLYQGPLEVWSDDEPILQLQVRHGLHSRQLVVQGLRWNGQLLNLRGKFRDSVNEKTLEEFRQQGINTVLTIPGENASSLCDWADRFGMLILFQISRESIDWSIVEKLSQHVACLGWLVPGDWWERSEILNKFREATQGKTLLGIDVQHTAPEKDFSGFSFVYCDKSREIKGNVLRLLRGNETDFPQETEGILGIICD